MTGERRPWSDPKASPLADVRPRTDPPPYRGVAKVAAREALPAMPERRPLPGDDTDPLQDALRAVGRRLAKVGAAEVEIGKCAEHGFHAATSAQKGRAHVTIEGTGRSPVAAVEDLDRLVAEHLGKRKGRR